MIRIDIPWLDAKNTRLTPTAMDEATTRILKRALIPSPGGRYWDARGLVQGGHGQPYTHQDVRSIELMGPTLTLGAAKDLVRDATAAMDLSSILIVIHKITEEGRVP